MPEARPSSAKAAFTLVELLVVIAIIGMLVGLLLPAVQAARESARRSSCQNNMKQLALACISYQAAAGGFPGCKDWTAQGSGGNARTWSFLIYAMPFLEQQPTYDQALTYYSTNAAGRSESDWRGSVAAGRRIVGLLCPSDPMSLSSATKWPTNYRGCAGDQTFNISNWGSYPHEAQKLLSGSVGLNGYCQYGTSPRSAIGSSFPKKITDGLSKTVLVGEAVIGDGSDSRLSGWATVTGYDWGTLPQDCLAATFTANTNTIGFNWTSSNAGQTWFYNTLPPNGPRCAHHNGTTSSYAGIPASSYHPGGAIVAMCDGGVRFISESIDTNNSPNMNPVPNPFWNQASRWGVWGAMATPAQRENYTYDE